MWSVRNYNSLTEAVRDLFGEARSVEKRSYVSGGDINEACVLTLKPLGITRVCKNCISFQRI